MAQIPDGLKALIGILKADAAVSAEVGTRVFGVELPPAESDSQPRKAIVIRQTGSGDDFGYMDAGETSYEIVHYGATSFEANEVRRAVYGALKQLRRTKQGGVLVHSATKVSGPIDFRFSGTDWPAVLETWMVLIAEKAAA